MIGEVIHQVLSLFLRHHLASDRKKFRCFDDADGDDSRHEAIIKHESESIDTIDREIPMDQFAKLGRSSRECSIIPVFQHLAAISRAESPPHGRIDRVLDPPHMSVGEYRVNHPAVKAARGPGAPLQLAHDGARRLIRRQMMIVKT